MEGQIQKKTDKELTEYISGIMSRRRFGEQTSKKLGIVSSM